MTHKPTRHASPARTDADRAPATDAVQPEGAALPPVEPEAPSPNDARPLATETAREEEKPAENSGHVLLLLHPFRGFDAGRVLSGSADLLGHVLKARVQVPVEPGEPETKTEPVAREATQHEVELAGPLIIHLDD